MPSAKTATEQEASGRIERIFNVILAPNSYSPLPTLGSYISDEPDIVFLHDLGNEDSSIPSSEPSLANETNITSNSAPQPLCNILDYSAHNDDCYVNHFRSVLAKKLSPQDMTLKQRISKRLGMSLSHSLRFGYRCVARQDNCCRIVSD